MSGLIRIPLENLKNTRDLGGIEAKDKKVIKPCRLIRSGELFEATDKDKQVLVQQYGLKTIVDFRTMTEVSEHPDPVLPGVRYINIPVLDENTLGITRDDESVDMTKQLLAMLSGDGFDAENYMAQIYVDIIKQPSARKHYREFLDVLLEQTEGSVLWHCSAGKDRVGMGTMFVLSALGVSKKTIMQDYMMTNTFLDEGNEKIAAKAAKATGNEEIGRRLKTVFSVHESYLQAVWQIIDETYGSMEQFLKDELGLDESRLKRLRALYLTS